MQFLISHRSSHSSARQGLLQTAHGIIETPAFMPVGTRGAVKTLTFQQLTALGTQIWLANSYHLMLRPGLDVILQAGGLHAFTGWNGPIASDSGGFQVFSLSSLNHVTDKGVFFKSHIDGTSHFLGPTESMQQQKELGVDIALCLDHYGSSAEAVANTLRWAKICRAFQLLPHQALFGIVQGGEDLELRRYSAKELIALDMDGYAIGGLEKKGNFQLLDVMNQALPENKPRYLMGVGTPRDIIEGVMRGVDLFDCVLPTRNGRRGIAYTWQGRLQMKSARFSRDFSPLDTETPSEAAAYSKAYIRYLLNIDEFAGQTLMTIQNLAFYNDLMKKIRQAVRDDTLDELYQKICSLYP